MLGLMIRFFQLFKVCRFHCPHCGGHLFHGSLFGGCKCAPDFLK